MGCAVEVAISALRRPSGRYGWCELADLRRAMFYGIDADRLAALIPDGEPPFQMLAHFHRAASVIVATVIRFR